MSKIKNVNAIEVLDSRGNPTLEVEIILSSNIKGSAIVPSGASTGEHEVLELRDHEERYNGLGVKKAIKNVNTIINEKLKGVDVLKQNLIDKILIDLDGTENKRKLGANAILGVSLACAKAAANYLNIPLYRYLGGFNTKVMPIPMMNILNGGVHASFCIDFQEIMIVPSGAKNFKEAIRMGSEIFHALKDILKERNYHVGLGDEGGYAPRLKSNKEAFDLIMLAIKKANYVPKNDVNIAIDVASSEFYNKITKRYVLKSENKELTFEEMVAYYETLINEYPLISIEDGLSEDDFEGWVYMSSKIGHKVQLVGDDLFVTNVKRLQKGIELKIANAILIKVNQIGTLSETFDVIDLAKKHNYGVIISHRSGESEDTTIADIALSINAGQIKTGSLSRSERTAKYNRLLKIEDEINKEQDLTIFDKDLSFYNF